MKDSRSAGLGLFMLLPLILIAFGILLMLLLVSGEFPRLLGGFIFIPFILVFPMRGLLKALRRAERRRSKRIDYGP